MLEKLFRNINDIRVFDLFYVEASKPKIVKIDIPNIHKIPSFDEHDKIPEYDTMDMVDILESLGYSEVERIQIQDSVQHLVDVRILEKIEKEDTASTGCIFCSCMDKLKLPRIGSHKTHKIYEERTEKIPMYRLTRMNEITINLFKALEEYNKRELAKHGIYNEEEF